MDDKTSYRIAFNALTVPMLRARAAVAGIAGRSKMNKAQLVDELTTWMLRFEDTQDAQDEVCLLEHGYRKPCQQPRGHAGECDKETVGLVRTKAKVPAQLCSHGIDVTQRCLICRDDANALGQLADMRHSAPTLQIHTGGELHPVPVMPVPDFVFNLSRLLDDPAHKPNADLLKLDGLDVRMQDFVFCTEGAMDLYETIMNAIIRQMSRGKSVVVLILCRGGKDRSVAFGDNLAQYFGVTATHHHRHLDRVPRGEKVLMLGHECVCGHLVAHHQETSWNRGGGSGRGACQIKFCVCERLVV